MIQPTIGLEIHVELNTQSKMFCSCLNDPREHHPNVNICPVCTGHPGILPVINQKAVKKVIKTGLALNCEIREHSKFDRKNYFYPDLPKGYQISQYDQPLCKRGILNKVRIRRIHLEEDTGRLVHPESTDYSLVDFNRAGVPLMELVTEPDLRSAKETRQFAQELRLILRYLDVSAADMEKGQLRVEANASLKGGAKVEIKNLNSFRAVEKALDYETERQRKAKKVVQETRGWDESREVTVPQRVKEEVQDYRYFPEPDLPPLHFTRREVKEIWAKIPELPHQRRKRFKKEYKLEDKEIEVFVFNKNLGEYFEQVISELWGWIEKKDGKLIKLTTNYIITDLQGLLKGMSVESPDFKITAENFAEFISLIYRGELSSKIAKLVLEEMVRTGKDPSNIMKKKKLTQITSKIEIEKVVKQVFIKNQKAVEDFKKGKVNAWQFLVGQVMAQTKGKASPDIVNKIMRKLL